MRYVGGIIGAPINQSRKIEYLGGIANSSVGVTTDITETFTDKLNIKKDDFLIFSYVVGGQANIVQSITSSGWITRQDEYVNSTQDTNMLISYKRVGNIPDTDITFSGTTNTAVSGAWSIMAFRNVDLKNPFDVADTTASSTTSMLVDPPSITPVTRNSIVVVAGGGAFFGSTSSVNRYSYLSYSTDLENFLSAGINDTNDATIGMGINTTWTSGALDLSTWTHDFADSVNNSYYAAAMALRPQQLSGFITLDDDYNVKIN